MANQPPPWPLLPVWPATVTTAERTARQRVANFARGRQTMAARRTRCASVADYEARLASGQRWCCICRLWHDGALLVRGADFCRRSADLGASPAVYTDAGGASHPAVAWRPREGGR